MDFYLTQKVVFLAIELAIVFCGAWVYLSDRKNKTKQSFILMAVSIFFWLFFYYNLTVSSDNPAAILWPKFGYFSVAWFFVFFYLFFIGLLGIKIKLLDKLVIGWWIFNSLISIFTNLMVKGIVFEDDAFKDLILGIWEFFYYGSALLTFSLILFFLFKKYRGSLPFEKLKYQYFIAGVFIWVLMNIIFNVIATLYLGSIRYAPFGNYSVIFFLALTAYAITKHELMGIKTLLTQAIIVVISIILLADVLFLSDNPTMQLLKLGVLLAFLYFSREMVKSAKKEKESREELEKASQNLASTNQKLRNLLAMKNDFLHIVSHQLRTPLTAMRGFISMWDDGDFDAMPKDKMADIKNKVVNNAERLNNIVNDMVLAMESEGELKVNIQSVDLEKFLAGNIEMQKPSFEKKNLYLKYAKTAKNIPKIEADERLLLNVFMNLIDNAEKYTEKGGLIIAAVQDGKNVKIDFIDTGIGLSNEDKKILFKKFSRGAKSNYINPNGSGLGLFIIKQIVSLHRGKIKAESEGEGKGSTFTVTLPVKQEK